MWIFLGGIAIVTALLNVICIAKGQETKWLMFISLSFTALTLCTFYSADAKWVINEDWSALSDVTPIMSKSLWACTIALIVVNSVSLFRKHKG